MTTEFRHVGCTSVVIAYCGDTPLDANPVMRSCDWALPDGSRITPLSSMHVDCPDCGERIGVGPEWLESISRG